MDTDRFIIDIKTEDVDEDIVNDVEKRFDTSNYEVNRPLPTIDEKRIRKKDYDRICSTYTQNIFVFNE